MKCLTCVALFCLIAIVSAGVTGTQTGIEKVINSRVRRQSNTFSSSSSSSSSSATGGGNGPVHFHQQTSGFNSFAPGAGYGSAPPNLNERFGGDDSSGSNQGSNQGYGQGNQGYGQGYNPGGGQFTQQSSSSSTQQNGGPVLFQQTSSSYNNLGKPNGSGSPNLEDRFGDGSSGGNNPTVTGHVTSVSGHYDPITNKVVYHHNYHKDV